MVRGRRGGGRHVVLLAGGHVHSASGQSGRTAHRHDGHAEPDGRSRSPRLGNPLPDISPRIRDRRRRHRDRPPPAGGRLSRGARGGSGDGRPRRAAGPAGGAGQREDARLAGADQGAHRRRRLPLVADSDRPRTALPHPASRAQALRPGREHAGGRGLVGFADRGGEAPADQQARQRDRDPGRSIRQGPRHGEPSPADERHRKRPEADRRRAPEAPPRPTSDGSTRSWPSARSWRNWPNPSGTRTPTLPASSSCTIRRPAGPGA